MRSLLPAVLLLVACGDGSTTLGPVTAQATTTPPVATDTAVAPPADTAATADTGTPPPAWSAAYQPGTVVQVEQGPIEGVDEGPLRVFRGIPFAAPPVDELRLRDPQPAPPWSDVLDATQFGPACPQNVAGPLSSLISVAGTDEDCLTLNVWGADTPEPKPVMVWIHGGAFILGSGAQGLYDGTDLAESGVVVVTVNYRMGALGYLAVPELGAPAGNATPGNFGLKDQLAALEWVRDNIAVFGGDPDNVTIFGESAGGISVCALGGVPQADGLYHRVIAQSGVGCHSFPEATTPTFVGQPAAIDQGREMLAKTPCEGAPDVLACLQALPVDELVGLVDPTELILGAPSDKALPVSPYVDGAFFTEQPMARYASGDLDVPMILGTNLDESTMFFGTTIVLTRDDFRQEVEDFVGDAALADALVDLYPFVEFPFAQDAFLTFTTDLGFTCPNLWLAQHSADGAPVYVYEFQEHNLTTLALGSHHGLELPYVFGTFPELAIVPIGDDYALSNAMQRAWTTFAADGVPQLDIGWPTYELGGQIVTFDDRIGKVSDDAFRGGRCEALASYGLFGAVP